MKKKFIAKKARKRRKLKLLFWLLLFCLGIYISFRIINKQSIKINDKEFVELLINSNNYTNKESTITKKIKAFLNETLNTPVLFIENNYDQKLEVIKSNTKNLSNNNSSDPIIYIYNSHQTEEYSGNTFIDFTIKPTVTMNDYILEEVFNKNNYKTIVEEASIKEILNQNNWHYNNSYKASRVLMEKAKTDNPSLLYFIDVHRDSLTKEKTTIKINDKSYARTIFLIGLENPNYEKNLAFTNLINDQMNKKYPGLSKGIYQKGGVGVNGIYNQDFSPQTILIEIGGVDNTTSEVLNSTLAFADCFLEVIGKNEG